MARISLSSSGYYATPKISWDRQAGKGRPFYYFAYGAAVAEAAIDTLTGETRLLRVDILHDCGRSLNPAVDLGQIEGGFVQGAGWLISEELVWSREGKLATHAPSTYKIPCASDRAPDMRVEDLAEGREPGACGAALQGGGRAAADAGHRRASGDRRGDHRRDRPLPRARYAGDARARARGADTAGMSEATRARLAAMAADRPVAVVIVAAADGSTPREAGAFMIVAADETVGTIGGGEAERRAVEAARKMLAGGEARAALTLPLGPELDQCCGGRLKLAIARVESPGDGPVALWPGGPVVHDPAETPVLVYGAGHVGAAVVTALAPLPFAVDWIDPRSEAIWPAPAPHPCRRLAIPEEAAMRAPPDAIHLVMTHSHAVDLEIVAAVLSRPFRFLGLIGSATKRATFERRLAERGLSAARMTSPIGLPQIRGKAPAVIAASVAAQLLALESAAAPEPARRHERETA